MDWVLLVKTSPLWFSMAILFFAAWVEYVFPPFPGDTILVAGGFFVAQGALPLTLTFIVLTLGSLGGCLTGWAIGHHGLGLKHLIKPEYLERIRKGYQRYGNWIILGNRVLPIFRGAFMVGAGLIKMPIRPIILWGTLSALIWNALLIGLGYLFSDSLEKLLELIQTYSKTVLIVIGLIAIGWGFTKMERLRSYKRRQAQKQEPETKPA